jgi:acyl-CoA synthetase (AMP-forming)/AMP-acid ligase II
LEQRVEKVLLLTALPRNPAGKIDYAALRDRFSRGE